MPNRGMRIDMIPNSSSTSEQPVRINESLFWAKVSTGISFGFASYFVTRFTGLPWYLLVPIFFVPTLLISKLVVSKTSRRESLRLSKHNTIRKAFNYSGSWLLAYIAFATIAYFLGW